MKQLIHIFRALSLSMCIACFFISHSCSDPGSTGQIEIDVTQKGAIISPNLFGHNLEHTRKGIWQGISAEMIANRKFAAVKGDLPAQWKGIAYGGTATLDLETVYVGDHSVRLENQGEATVAIAQQHEWLTFIKGTKYIFRVWIKSDSEQSLWMGIRDRYSARSWMIREETISEPGDWQLWSGEFTAPLTLKNARLEIGNSGEGTSWIGAISMIWIF